MTSEKELLANGYKRYKPSVVDGECVTDLYQKCFRDDTGKKYYINVKRWDMSRYSDANHTYPVSFEYDVQMYQKKTHNAVNIEFFSDWTLADVEEHVEWLFSSGRFDYYEKF